jgi:exopolysaccharide biosynthesis polyprenyl glycosylphosphotransferase
VVGVIFTETGAADTNALCDTIRSKVHSALQTNLGSTETEKIRILFRIFPEDPRFPDGGSNGGSLENRSDLYPDLHRKTSAQKAAQLIKRAIDVTASITALTLLSPLFLAIAIAIKLTSKGPVLFQQERVGQYGKHFTFLKFRSMYVLNDSKIHRDYVKKFISGKETCKQGDGNGGAYKLTRDPRITRVGHFLRRTSLDELPQFLNVLRGDMSLVGPRPPIPYETEIYDIWHRRRFLEVKPGITGLWQISGRSRLKFDEMVRLDIKYARDWSLWLDFKILLATPRAVLSCDGAY